VRERERERGKRGESKHENNKQVVQGKQQPMIRVASDLQIRRTNNVLILFQQNVIFDSKKKFVIKVFFNNNKVHCLLTDK